MGTEGLAIVLVVATILLVLAVGGLAFRARRLAGMRLTLTGELERVSSGMAERSRTLEQQRRAYEELEAAVAATQQRYEEIIAAVPAAIVTYDKKGVVLSEEGGALARLFGENRAVGKKVDEARAAAAPSVAKALAGEHFTVVEGASDRRLETSYSPTASGGVLAVSVDLRERDGLERAWRQSEARSRQMFEEAPFGAALVAADGRIIRANAALSEALGFTSDELGVLRFDEIVYPGDGHAEELQRERMAKGEIESYRVEQRLRRKDGEAVVASVTTIALRDDRRLSGRLLMLRDLSGRRHDEQIAEQFARRDAVTGLPNRLAFEERLPEIVVRAGKDKERMGLVFFDVHNAAAIAERIGPRGRDGTLRELVGRLHTALPEVESLARLGVSTFAFTLARRGAAGTAEAVEKLVAALEDGLPVEGVRVHADLRLGFAMFPEDADSADDLMRRADAALAHATRGARRYLRYQENVAV